MPRGCSPSAAFVLLGRLPAAQSPDGESSSLARRGSQELPGSRDHLHMGRFTHVARAARRAVGAGGFQGGSTPRFLHQRPLLDWLAAGGRSTPRRRAKWTGRRLSHALHPCGDLSERRLHCFLILPYPLSDTTGLQEGELSGVRPSHCSGRHRASRHRPTLGGIRWAPAAGHGQAPQTWDVRG